MMSQLNGTTTASTDGSSEENVAKNCFRLLSLPDVVKGPFLQAIAENGLHELLKFRMVCKETKDWVDEASPQIAKKLFSRAKVSMDCDLENVKRFVKTPPPFLVDSLTLYVNEARIGSPGDPSGLGTAGFRNRQPALSLDLPEGIPPKDAQIWDIFCDYWKPRLATLQIRKKDNERVVFIPKEIQDSAHVIRKLLDSPNLDKISVVDWNRHCNWKLSLPIPTCFQRVSEISLGSILSWSTPAIVIEEFFSALENNANLRTVSLDLSCRSVINRISKLAEKNRNNKQFRLYLCLEEENAKGLFHQYGNGAELLKLFQVIANCEFEVPLHLDFHFQTNRCLQKLQNDLGNRDYWRVLNSLERFRSGEIPNPSLLELHTLEKLKQISFYATIPGEEVRLPPNLLQLECGQPPVRNLPLGLKELTLNGICGTLDELEELLISLSVQCVELEKLNLQWYDCNDTPENRKGGGRKGSGQNQATCYFPALKSLVLRGHELEGHVVRDLLLDRLKLDQMPLLYLKISFHSDIRHMGGVDPFGDIQQVHVEGFEMDDDEWIVERNSRSRPVPVGLEAAGLVDDNRIEVEEEEEIEMNHIVSAGTYNNMVRLMNEEILSKLCEGPIGKTLLFLDISKDIVSLNGLPALETFQSKVSDNLKEQIRLKGRGQWLYEYPVQENEDYVIT